MKKINLIFIFLFIVLSNQVSAQIISGNVNVFDTYFDVAPDSCLESSPSHLSPLHGEMYIDIDGNGINDFFIVTSGGGGLGGGGAGASISAVDSAAWVVAHDDSAMGYPGVMYDIVIVDTINAGITIGSNMSLKRIGSFFHVTYGAASGAVTNYWKNIGEHFVGIALTYNNDTIYGWIRVELDYNSYYVLTIKDYACEKNPYSISSHLNEQIINLYPNPAKDYLIVQNNIVTLCNFQFEIYDEIGKKISGCNAMVQNGICRLDIRNFAKGIYFLNMVTNNYVLKSKFVKE